MADCAAEADAADAADVHAAQSPSRIVRRRELDVFARVIMIEASLMRARN